MSGGLTFVQISIGAETVESCAVAEAFLHSTPDDSDQAIEAEMP